MHAEIKVAGINVHSEKGHSKKRLASGAAGSSALQASMPDRGATSRRELHPRAPSRPEKRDQRATSPDIPIEAYSQVGRQMSPRQVHHVIPSNLVGITSDRDDIHIERIAINVGGVRVNLTAEDKDAVANDVELLM